MTCRTQLCWMQLYFTGGVFWLPESLTIKMCVHKTVTLHPRTMLSLRKVLPGAGQSPAPVMARLVALSATQHHRRESTEAGEQPPPLKTLLLHFPGTGQMAMIVRRREGGKGRSDTLRAGTLAQRSQQHHGGWGSSGMFLLSLSPSAMCPAAPSPAAIRPQVTGLLPLQAVL